MSKLRREDLYSLEKYSVMRDEFRKQVMDHKKNRRVAIGDHVALYFEDEMTMRYQIQEMLRIERIFEDAAIQDELDTYNALIPEGSNWKATAMLEFEDVDVRRRRLAELTGLENLVWMQVADNERAFAIANEDLERSTEEKTSAVHFMRFELTPAMIAGLRNGGALSFGCDHEGYRHQARVSAQTRSALMQDLD